MTACALGDAIERGTIDPCDLTEHFLARIAAVDSDHAIYLRTTGSRARAEAAAARVRARRGLRASPLDGVPISWKDLFDTAGDVTSHGTLALAERVAERDAEVVARATRAGLVCLGKTNQSEFAFSILGLNPKLGTPPNPFDTAVDRLPGGSSSGAAVSLSRGLAAGAIGSDTGGSVRVPAAWNGLVGLKTSFGNLPLDGTLGLSTTMDTAGPLARDVADAAALYAVMGARFGAGNPHPPDLNGARLDRLALALPSDVAWDGLDPGVEEAARGAIETLARAGCAVKQVPVPEFRDTEALIGHFGPYHAAECHALWHDVIDARPDLIHTPILERIRLGKQMSASDTEEAKQTLHRQAASLHRRMADGQLLTMPTVAIGPPPIADLEADIEVWKATNVAALRNTRFGNFLDCCALTLPCGHDHHGIPVGLMLMAAPFEEERLLRAGALIEAALNK